MKWKDCIGKYTAYISLGSNCQAAYQLNRLGLRQFAGPLDWFASESVPGLVQLLRNRMKGFMEFKNLQLIDTAQDCFVVRDNVYNIVSFHDFPVHLNVDGWWKAYPAFKEKIDRRVLRFWQMISNKPVLFVRTDTTMKEAEQLTSALNTLTYGNFRLLIVNNHLYHPPAVLEEEWRLDGVCSVTVPQGFDWRGSNEAWNAVMNGFSR
jgi:hypothetical protein